MKGEYPQLGTQGVRFDGRREELRVSCAEFATQQLALSDKAHMLPPHLPSFKLDGRLNLVGHAGARGGVCRLLGARGGARLCQLVCQALDLFLKRHLALVAAAARSRTRGEARGDELAHLLSMETSGEKA